MKFNTQVCTTREQSERLLALGLKPGTADMCLDGDIIDEQWIPIALPPTLRHQFPAWSLHRLMEIADFRGTAFLDISEAYETLIEDIKSKIRFKLIDKSLIDSKQERVAAGRGTGKSCCVVFVDGKPKIIGNDNIKIEE